jgi:hypothetical protein
VCLTTKALRHNGVWESGCVDPRILDLGISWRRVVSFTRRLLCRRRGAPDTLWITRLRGTQNRSGRHGEEKNLALPGLKLQSLIQSSRSHSLYRLRSVIFYHLDALRKYVLAVSLLLVCLFVNAQRSNPHARIDTVITLSDLSNVPFPHVRLIAPQKCRELFSFILTQFSLPWPMDIRQAK